MAWAIAALATTGACGREDDRPATFTYVYETVIAPSCATIGCHNKVSQTYGLQFETKAGAYAGLTGKACNEEDDLPGEAVANYVRPGDLPDEKRVGSGLLGCDFALNAKSGRYTFSRILSDRDWNSLHGNAVKLARGH